MKILHSADWHLGAKNLRLPTVQQQLLKEETMEDIHRFFEFAKSRDFDIVLIVGDLFHTKNISQKLLINFASAVENYGNPVIYIEGNHDENFIFSNPMPENFIVLTKENFKFSYKDFDFYSDYNGAINLDNSKTNILILHGNIENSRDNDFLNINKYLDYPFDYIALGHVHSYKKYKKGDRIFAYSGSLYSNGFDECGDKGFLEIRIENKKIENLEFCPFATRKYMICECDITESENNQEIINRISNEMSKTKINKNDLVRVILKGEIDENLSKSLNYISNYFGDYFYFEVIDKSRFKIDIEKIKNEKLSFKYEFISLVEASDLSEEDKTKICELGLNALKGEDLSL